MHFVFFRNLDESLFAAESFEDLSHEVETNRLDGECSSRTVSVSSGSFTADNKI